MKTLEMFHKIEENLKDKFVKCEISGRNSENRLVCLYLILVLADIMWTLKLLFEPSSYDDLITGKIPALMIPGVLSKN